MWFYLGEMHPKDADRRANSEDPDQSAPSRWTTLFAQMREQSDLGLHYLSRSTCPSENLGSLMEN